MPTDVQYDTCAVCTADIYKLNVGANKKWRHTRSSSVYCIPNHAQFDDVPNYKAAPMQQREPTDLDLKWMLHQNKAEVEARGHTWDIADVMGVFHEYLNKIEKEL
jgi:hypothetical protein